MPVGTTGVVVAIHTFGEYLDFHPHLHALAADGLFVDSGLFQVMPDVRLAPLEELFRARAITFLVKKGLLPPERARICPCDFIARITKCRALGSQSSICRHPTMETRASRSKPRANAPEGRKRFPISSALASS